MRLSTTLLILWVGFLSSPAASHYDDDKSNSDDDDCTVIYPSEEWEYKEHQKYKSKYKDDHGVEHLDNFNIQTAVDQWLFNRTGATQRFGSIETWDTSSVTWMWHLFKDASTFNDDISAWDTSCVSSMEGYVHVCDALYEYNCISVLWTIVLH